MDDRRPAISLVAVAGKRQAALDAAAEADRRGFAGIACPSIGGAMGLCASLAHVTETIPFWTSIQPIYLSNPHETAVLAGHISETSGGRFTLGLGVSHGPMHQRLGLAVGRPLADTKAYVEALRSSGEPSLPPVALATLRDKMLGLATEISDGAIWANAARSAMGPQLARVPAAERDGFFLANMVPTVIDEDRAAAEAIHRRTLTGYVALPNYRNYWKQAGYLEEMEAIEKAQATDPKSVPNVMSDRWLRDCTLSGSATEVRDGVAAWWDLGVTPIAVMSSTTGGQIKALQQLFDIYD
jgi:alkanesulfonate monooxygenase SsuD/methylene tetrahydromethanopterin reductase-like flavin-dependent oxidoreductase (luciferase family)